MTALYINWNPNPEIFTIGDWGPRWYGILFALGFVVGYYLMLKIFKKEGIKQEVLDSLTMHIFLGTLIGARLGHCLFYEPAYYLSNPVEIIKVWKGGLASHGAAVGIFIALYLFAKKHKRTLVWVLDTVMVAIPFALFCIRMGNLMNSEIYGHVTNLPWGFIFERNGETEPKHPTQLYEALSYLLTFGIMYYLGVIKQARQQRGLIFGLSFIFLFTARFIIEFVKENQVDFEAAMTLNMGQWLSIPFILMGITVLYLSYTKKLEKF